jgi:hypothetical protein
VLCTVLSQCDFFFQQYLKIQFLHIHYANQVFNAA